MTGGNREVGGLRAAVLAGAVVAAGWLAAPACVGAARAEGDRPTSREASDNARGETALARRAREAAAGSEARRWADRAAGRPAAARGGGGAAAGRSSDSPPAPPRLPGIPFPTIDPPADEGRDLDLFGDRRAPREAAAPADRPSRAEDVQADPEYGEARPAEAEAADAEGASPDASGAETAEESADDPGDGAARTYAIRSGDTFSALAVRFYGEERKWKLIAEANPDVDPQRLKVGQEIRLPDAEPAERERGGEGGAASDDRRSGGEGAAAGDRERTIKVESGDTLSHIAQRVYGKARLWEELLGANRDQLDDPTDLKAGMTLRVPELSDDAD